MSLPIRFLKGSQILSRIPLGAGPEEGPPKLCGAALELCCPADRVPTSYSEKIPRIGAPYAFWPPTGLSLYFEFGFTRHRLECLALGGLDAQSILARQEFACRHADADGNLSVARGDRNWV